MQKCEKWRREEKKKKNLHTLIPELKWERGWVALGKFKTALPHSIAGIHEL